MEKTKKIVLISTRVGKPGQEDKWKIFEEIIPEAKVYNIIDDSLVDEAQAAGKMTPNVIARLASYYRNAEMIGADLIYNQCSVTGEAAELARQMVNIPVIREDQAMAEAAAKLGGRIAVISPMMASIDPTCIGIQRAADTSGTKVILLKWLVEEAQQVQKEQGEEAFLKCFADYIHEHADEADVIVLAQGNISPVAELVADIGKPVLTSPIMGITRARRVLFE